MEIFGFFYLPILALTIINLVMAAVYGTRLKRGRGRRNGIVMVVSLFFSIAAITLTGIASLLIGGGWVGDWAFLCAPGVLCVAVTLIVFKLKPLEDVRGPRT